MKEVGKYNLFKMLSILITCVPPLITLYFLGDLIVYDAGASVSTIAIFVMIAVAFFLKNKLLENFKTPSALWISIILFALLISVEQIIVPAKWVTGVTALCLGIDELTFKRIYKRIELLLPEKREAYKHFGFYFCKTSKITGESKNE